MPGIIQSYIKQFNDLFSGTPWLDETFRKKLDPLSESQAFKQAPNNNHSVAEVVSHIIVWRREVLRRLRDNSPERGLTDESTENWKKPEILQQQGWQKLYNDFEQCQQELVAFLTGKNDAFLNEPLAGSGYNMEYFVAGLLHHDAYHLGQIGLILKWA